ncbi:MAG: YbaN family protein [Fimbriimonadaceae bacterium]|nr:YbaN family protein [Chthonomonadaceae bacterium]MCO5295859.1 YbaN family protein [Fimbriimonadaceae bacterium]
MAKPLAPSSRTARAVYLGLGFLCVAIGMVNLAIPGLPSTVFFIVALAAFERSSPRMERWLLEHRLFGSTLRNWRQSGSIAPRTKVVAITAIWVCIGISAWVVGPMWLKGLLLAIALALTAYLATRPSACG